MKELNKIFLMAALLLVIASCSKKEDASPNSPNQADLESNLQKEGWTVAYFEDRGVDETHYFNTYLIRFMENGTLIVTGGTAKSQYTGSWMISSVSDDNSTSSQKLIMSISGNDIVNELDEDWKVVEFTQNSLKLFDQSKDHTTYLNLVRQ